MVIPLFKKGGRRVCSNYRGITLLSFPVKVYLGVLEKRVQCGFRPERGTVDQLYTLSRVSRLRGSLPKQFTDYFVDLKKAFDQVPNRML